MERHGSQSRRAVPGRGATLLGATGLVLVGFFFGIVAGAMWEDPRLVLGHVAGNTTDVVLGDLDTQGDDSQEIVGGVAAAASPPAETPKSPEPVVSTAPPRARVAESSERRVPAVSSPPPGFVIQVGAFGDRSGAAGLAAELRNAGFPVQLTTREGATRVRVGPFASRREAERQSRVLKTRHGLPTWIQPETTR